MSEEIQPFRYAIMSRGNEFTKREIEAELCFVGNEYKDGWVVEVAYSRLIGRNKKGRVLSLGWA